MAGIGISNSSPIIVLSAAGRLDLLTSCFDTIIIPEEVASEVQSANVDFARIVRIKNRDLLHALASQIDLGEAAAITLTCETPSATVIMDDRKGRSAALKLGLSLIGTVGLVVKAKKLGRLEHVKPVLEAIMRAGLYLEKSIVERALKESGE